MRRWSRVRSILRIKALHDTVQEQAAQLADWNRTLEQRVAAQLAEIERLGRLKRFFSPQLAELIVSAGDERLLESHRREITVVFCDLRGFTAFAETSEPEEVMGVLRQYHEALGELIFRHEGTLERFAGRRPVSCCSTIPALPRSRRARRAHGRRDARRVAELRGLAPAGPRPRLRHRHRPGLRHPRAHRLRGPLRLRRDRHGRQPRLAALRSPAPLRQCLHHNDYGAKKKGPVRLCGSPALAGAGHPGQLSSLRLLSVEDRLQVSGARCKSTERQCCCRPASHSGLKSAS